MSPSLLATPHLKEWELSSKLQSITDIRRNKRNSFLTFSGRLDCLRLHFPFFWICFIHPRGPGHSVAVCGKGSIRCLASKQDFCSGSVFPVPNSHFFPAFPEIKKTSPLVPIQQKLHSVTSFSFTFHTGLYRFGTTISSSCLLRCQAVPRGNFLSSTEFQDF